MAVAIGLGLMEFPFSDARAWWRWVDLCESGGADSLWQTDRLVSKEPILECMAVMAALAETWTLASLWASSGITSGRHRSAGCARRLPSAPLRWWRS